MKTLRFIFKSSLKFTFYKFIEVYLSYFLLTVKEKYIDQTLTLKQYARRFNIPYIKIQNVNDKKFSRLLASLQLDYVFSYCPQIYKKQTLSSVKSHFINSHGALLPEYRGAASGYFWCLHNSEQNVGYTIHIIDEGIDSGDIYHREEYPYNGNDSAYKVNYRTIKSASIMLPKIYHRIKDNAIHPYPQDEKLAKLYSFPSRKAMKIFLKKGRKLIRFSDLFHCL
jgi:methionyl-tRNA formyltransferase